jgi:hypothetical protein
MEEALKNLREEIAPGKFFVFPSRIIQTGVDGAKKEIRSKIKLLGATGKANHFLFPGWRDRTENPDFAEGRVPPSPLQISLMPTLW